MFRADEVGDQSLVDKMVALVSKFYEEHTEIKVSHGLQHVLKVFEHATKAACCALPPLPRDAATQVRLAALLHDTDDSKYFPDNSALDNARGLLAAAGITEDQVAPILEMIHLVSCSKNGNRVPAEILEGKKGWYYLIPRWSDRLEAVGAVGVVRCFQYNTEHGQPMCTDASPRPTTEAEVWKYATPERFEKYMNGGNSSDMISHYYDKLLHVARPPADIVRNQYLEAQAEESSKELVEMCLRFSRTGKIDEEYVQELAQSLEN